MVAVLSGNAEEITSRTEHRVFPPAGVLIIEELSIVSLKFRAVRTILAVFCLLLFCAAPASAGPFENGKAALHRYDYETALRLLQPLAEKGDAEARFTVCEISHDSEKLEKWCLPAMRQFREAADQGKTRAMWRLGEMYLYGLNVPDDEKDMWRLRQILDLPNDEAEADKWFQKALQSWRPQAEQGNAEAQFRLGWMYYYGEGVTEDRGEAMDWWRRAAEQGYAVAQFRLGRSYADGDGAKEDKAAAAKWWRLSADAGNVEAQHDLGWLYYLGAGVQQDFAEAARYWRMAALQGDSLTQRQLGDLYYSGKGVNQDYAQAALWYRKAAEQGDVDAQNDLAAQYAEGKGVEQDAAEAAKWSARGGGKFNVYARNSEAGMVLGVVVLVVFAAFAWAVRTRGDAGLSRKSDALTAGDAPAGPAASVPKPAYAGFIQRAVAFQIDLVNLLAISYLARFIVAENRENFRLYNLFVELLQAGYFTVFECSSWRATPGKKLFRIYVAGEDGERISPSRALLRYLILVISCLPIILFSFSDEANTYATDRDYREGTDPALLLRFAWFAAVNIIFFWLPIIFTKQKTGLHDFWTRTRVFRQEKGQFLVPHRRDPATEAGS